MTNEEAIKGLKVLAKDFSGYKPNEEMFDIAIQAIEQTTWIPVSERLPTREEYIKSNGLFIVSDGNRSYAEYFDIYDKRMFGEPTMEGFRVDRCISAWMPLPPSYQGE